MTSDRNESLMKCAVCVELSFALYSMTTYDPEFYIHDAVTIMKGHAVCECHMPYFDNKVSAIASDISKAMGADHRQRNARF